MKRRKHRAAGFTRTAGDQGLQAAGGNHPLVVLTGRPNVGKSTIFNRIVGESRAVVERTPGVTRDRLYAPAEWGGTPFVVTDTGGLGGGDGDPFAPLVAAQARTALGEADVILLVVDAGAGLLPADEDIAAELRRLRKPVVLVANKADRARAAVHEFYALGLGEPWPVSAIHGEGLGDVLDRARELTRQAPTAEVDASGDDAPVAVAFVGRPNVGKSSLVNRLLGHSRLIVSELAGTTRDAVDIPWESDGRRFVLVDTPGLRKPARIDPHSLERWSANRSTRAITRSEVAAIVLDCGQPCTEQDKRIGGVAADHRRATVVILNKADLLSPSALSEVVAEVRRDMPFLGYAPIVACSAATGQGTKSLPTVVAGAADAYRRRMGTARLNQCIRESVAVHPPASFEGKAVRIYYATQIRTQPPTIALVTNRRGAVSDAYTRYLENRLRERFNLEGTPLRWVFRERPHRRLVLGSRPDRG